MVHSDSLKTLLKAWGERIIDINRELKELDRKIEAITGKRTALKAEYDALGDGRSSIGKVLKCMDGSAWAGKG